MTNQHWREVVEIVGVVAIVASLILVASELRENNRIAAAQTEQQLRESFNVLNSARATDPEFAKLFPKIEAPESHLITATDSSQIRGIVLHLTTIQWSVHSAHKNKLIDRKTRDSYVADFASTLEKWPAVRPYFVELYEDSATMQSVAVFKPIARYALEQAAEDPAAETE